MNTSIQPYNDIVTKVKFFFKQLKIKIAKSTGRKLLISPEDTIALALFKQAEGIIQYLEQTVIMQSLRNTPDRFLSQLSALLANKEVTNKDFGILAWAPHLVDQYQKKDHVRELSARYERSSQYTGRVGDKITFDFTLISKHYVKTLDCYAVYGITENDNLVFYWAKSLDKVCEVGRIQGRIKAHNEDEYHSSAKVTTLNYVKFL